MMLGKKQFHVDLAGFADPRGVCENLHAFLNLVVAGGNEMVDSLHFYNADTAGTDLVDIFQIAKIRNVKTVVAAGVQNPGSSRTCSGILLILMDTRFVFTMMWSALL